jgi:CubicO group peptidase (beta-lactamase class C family)
MAYSNLGVQHLAMYLVEVVSGQSFPDYVAEHFLEPLALDGSSFEASTYPVSQLAVPYARLDDHNVALPATGMSGSGRLRMTASDLATVLIAHMNAGEVAGVSILEPESVSLMHREHVDLYGTDWGQLPFRGGGLGWWLWTNRRSGHGGSTPGYSVKMVMQETELGSLGVVVMMNRGCSLSCDEDWYNSHVVVLRELLLDHAAELQDIAAAS